MDEPSTSQDPPDRQPFARMVGSKAARKLKAQQEGRRAIWFGLGMMGLIGWSVVVPTLAGVIVGLWLDQHFPARNRWTLTLLIAGLTIGCVNAWLWVAKEDKAIHDEQKERANDHE